MTQLVAISVASLEENREYSVRGIPFSIGCDIFRLLQYTLFEQKLVQIARFIYSIT